MLNCIHYGGWDNVKDTTNIREHVQDVVNATLQIKVVHDVNESSEEDVKLPAQEDKKRKK